MPAFLFFLFLFCRYQSYCFPPRELLLLAQGGRFFVNCVLFWGSFSRPVMNLLLKRLHESNIWRKTEKKKDVALEKLGWDGGGLFSLVSDFNTRRPSVELGIQPLLLLQTVGQVQQFVLLWMCPGETVCLTASRSLNPAVKTLFRSLVALILKIWWTLSSFTSQSFELLTASVWNHEVVPFIWTRNPLDWFTACTHFYLRKFKYDSKINLP